MVSFLGGMLNSISTQHLPMVSYASFFHYILTHFTPEQTQVDKTSQSFISSFQKDDSGTLSDYSLPYAISHMPLLLTSLHVLQVFIFA